MPSSDLQTNCDVQLRWSCAVRATYFRHGDSIAVRYVLTTTRRAVAQQLSAISCRAYCGTGLVVGRAAKNVWAFGGPDSATARDSLVIRTHDKEPVRVGCDLVAAGEQ